MALFKYQYLERDLRHFFSLDNILYMLLAFMGHEDQ